MKDINENSDKRKYYILSGMNKENNYNFYPNIANILKEELKPFDKIVYISAYPNEFGKSLKLADSDIFKNIGINFKDSIVLDYSYTKEEASKIIENSDLIFLYGGDPYEQIKFINDYEITNLLAGKTLITLSAGSINLSKISICTKDEEFAESSMYKGMGIIDFSIEPHFDINNKEVLEDLKKYSNKTDIYALEDDAFIIIENSKINFYGNVYLIENENIIKIN